MLATALSSALILAGCATAGAPGSQATTASHVTSPSNPPSDSNALREAAISSSKTQDYVAAAAYWGNLYDRDGNDIEAALNYSKSLRQIGSIAQSLSVMKRAQQAKPNDAEVLAEYGKTLAASGHPDQAAGVLAQANQLNPGDWTVLSAQGVAFDQMGRYADAQTKYNEALLIDPNNPSVLTNLGLSLAIEGKLDEAEQTLRKAVANPSANASARQNLSVVLGLQGKFDEATRLARADLPNNIAENNIAYLRDMLTQPALWKQMENLDKSVPPTH